MRNFLIQVLKFLLNFLVLIFHRLLMGINHRLLMIFWTGRVGMLFEAWDSSLAQLPIQRSRVRYSSMYIQREKYLSVLVLQVNDCAGGLMSTKLKVTGLMLIETRPTVPIMISEEMGNRIQLSYQRYFRLSKMIIGWIWDLKNFMLP